jgi:hypothetical protein
MQVPIHRANIVLYITSSQLTGLQIIAVNRWGHCIKQGNPLKLHRREHIIPPTEIVQKVDRGSRPRKFLKRHGMVPTEGQSFACSNGSKSFNGW